MKTYKFKFLGVLLGAIGKEQKFIKTIQAEKYQNSLYNTFNYVQLISSPLWSEEGLYIWEISN
jgi:hypothetical protein